ncbi:hypothetical protein ACFQ1M_09830 [Sungkyunkwania multivorans]|uniref:CBS domain-containing protein n=1 Tax=Sungkyunkwania multivorans TaxID=1173618 RepID=A0ABW3CXI9_9FLAO
MSTAAMELGAIRVTTTDLDDIIRSILETGQQSVPKMVINEMITVDAEVLSEGPN